MMLKQQNSSNHQQVAPKGAASPESKSLSYARLNAIDVDGRTVVYEPVTSIATLCDNDESKENASHSLLLQIDNYSSLIAETLYACPDLQTDLLAQLEQAKERLQRMHEQDTDSAWMLNRAQFDVRRVHVAIARKQRDRVEEERLRLLVPVLLAVYIAVVIGMIVSAEILNDENGMIKILNIPVSILVWATLGSIAAMLYRFYAIPRAPIAQELNWLIARPLIGIIMGALAYITVKSGLFIFGSAVGESTNTAPNAELLAVIAFVAGFSDRFFEALIGAITKYVPDADPDPANEPAAQTKVSSVSTLKQVEVEQTVTAEIDEVESPPFPLKDVAETGERSADA